MEPRPTKKTLCRLLNKAEDVHKSDIKDFCGGHLNQRNLYKRPWYKEGVLWESAHPTSWTKLPPIQPYNPSLPLPNINFISDTKKEDINNELVDRFSQLDLESSPIQVGKRNNRKTSDKSKEREEVLLENKSIVQEKLILKPDRTIVGDLRQYLLQASKQRPVSEQLTRVIKQDQYEAAKTFSTNVLKKGVRGIGEDLYSSTECIFITNKLRQNLHRIGARVSKYRRLKLHMDAFDELISISGHLAPTLSTLKKEFDDYLTYLLDLGTAVDDRLMAEVDEVKLACGNIASTSCLHLSNDITNRLLPMATSCSSSLVYTDDGELEDKETMDSLLKSKVSQKQKSEMVTQFLSTNQLSANCNVEDDTTSQECSPCERSLEEVKCDAGDSKTTAQQTASESEFECLSYVESENKIIDAAESSNDYCRVKSEKLAELAGYIMYTLAEKCTPKVSSKSELNKTEDGHKETGYVIYMKDKSREKVEGRQESIQQQSGASGLSSNKTGSSYASMSGASGVSTGSDLSTRMIQSANDLAAGFCCHTLAALARETRPQFKIEEDVRVDDADERETGNQSGAVFSSGGWGCSSSTATEEKSLSDYRTLKTSATDSRDLSLPELQAKLDSLAAYAKRLLEENRELVDALIAEIELAKHPPPPPQVPPVSPSRAWMIPSNTISLEHRIIEAHNQVMEVYDSIREVEELTRNECVLRQEIRKLQAAIWCMDRDLEMYEPIYADLTSSSTRLQRRLRKLINSANTSCRDEKRIWRVLEGGDGSVHSDQWDWYIS